MTKYTTIIGLEIHAQLKTKSKMFCSCVNGFGLEGEANIHICPVCTGQPGSLPVANEEAIKRVIKTGLALNCVISDFSKFDRKNYFYPDLPKGYQISQYDMPLCQNGFLNINDSHIKIRRIHLEEDTGKLMHPSGVDYSLIDYNRAGVPLMELVTDPDIRIAQEAKNFCQELQLILRYLDVSDADMERGQMRCEVNISLQKVGAPDLSGTKVEIKNLNSFKTVERAIEYEIDRQGKLLENGEKIIQETRGWDDNKQITFSQRIKEEAHDYRYFPEPDLPPLNGLIELGFEIAKELPELPQQKRIRFKEEYLLPDNDVEVFINNKDLAGYFEGVISDLDEWRKNKKREFKENREKMIGLTANYLINALPRAIEELKLKDYDLIEKITQENFAEFIILTGNKVISSAATHAVLLEMLKTGVDPSHILGEKDLTQISDEGQLGQIADEVIKNNPKAIDDYRAGKQNALQFLAGQVMKETRGRANPQVIQEILKGKLDNP